MKNRKIILGLITDAMFLALIAVMSFVPYLGYITIGTIDFTTIHIVVLIGAMLFGKWKGGIYGLFFGVFSLLAALGKPGTVNFLFVNPFVSVLPRVLFGFLAGLFYESFRKRMKPAHFFEFGAVFAAFFTILHSFLTLGCLYVFGYLDIFKITDALGASVIVAQLDAVFGSFLAFMLVFVSVGAVVESLVAGVIVPLASFGVYKVTRNSPYEREDLVTFAEEDKLSKRTVIIILCVAAVLVVAFVTAALIFYFNH